jgi:hypothetical protein
MAAAPIIDDETSLQVMAFPLCYDSETRFAFIA